MNGRPVTGVGIGLRRRHFGELPETELDLDFLELVPENFIVGDAEKGGRYARVLAACSERWPVLAHGISMSVGGPDPLAGPESRAYLRALKALLDRLDAPFYSDHLCFASLGGHATYDLLPMPFSEEAVHHTAARVRQLADILERPVALENISYYARMPGSELDEGAFVSAVVEEADCLLLLDINNIYVNARNHGQDPSEMLWALPGERACQIHLAGHKPEGPRLLDNHGAPVADPVWALYREAITELGSIPTLIEWDTHIPELAVVVAEAERARAIQREVEAERQRLAPREVAL